jgi:ABC-2 type transport system permease protein
MPQVLHAFAEHQPITPIVETLRALMMGTPVGGDGPIAVAWCVAILVAGAVGATAIYRRRRAG